MEDRKTGNTRVFTLAERKRRRARGVYLSTSAPGLCLIVKGFLLCVCTGRSSSAVWLLSRVLCRVVHALSRCHSYCAFNLLGVLVLLISLNARAPVLVTTLCQWVGGYC